MYLDFYSSTLASKLKPTPSTRVFSCSLSLAMQVFNPRTEFRAQTPWSDIIISEIRQIGSILLLTIVLDWVGGDLEHEMFGLHLLAFWRFWLGVEGLVRGYMMYI